MRAVSNEPGFRHVTSLADRTGWRWEPHAHVCSSGAQEMLQRLEADGLTLVIITNGHHEIQRDKLARWNADSAIRHILVGGEEVPSHLMIDRRDSERCANNVYCVQALARACTCLCARHVNLSSQRCSL